MEIIIFRVLTGFIVCLGVAFILYELEVATGELKEIRLLLEKITNTGENNG